VSEIYGKEHKEKIIQVILYEAIEHLSKASARLDKVLEALSSEVLNYLAIDCDFYEAGVHITKSYMKTGYPASLAEFFEPALGHVNTAMLMWQGCFHEWKSASGRGTTKPPGLTQHAALSISIEISGAKYFLSALHDVIFDKMTGLAGALGEIDAIRILTDS
jgi:hypothetical protein